MIHAPPVAAHRPDLAPTLERLRGEHERIADGQADPVALRAEVDRLNG